MKLYLNGDIIIPPKASEKVVQQYKNGAKAEAHYFINRKRVGVRRWWENSDLAYEWATDGAVKHGRWVRFHSNGVPDLEGRFLKGSWHGIRMQFDRRGRLIGTSEFRNGNGVDLWFLGPGELSEEWHYRKDLLHGIERWWRNRKHVHREAYWRHGALHGIARDWNLKGRLRRGFPQYWINGKQVTKREYLKACLSDPSLRMPRESDNNPRRAFPTRLVEIATRRVRAIRKYISPRDPFLR